MSATSISGVDRLKRRLLQAKRSAPQRMQAATVEALGFLEAQAQRILQEEVYSHQTSEEQHHEGPPEHLYASFVQKVEAHGKAIHASLANTSHHAPYWEFGTARGIPAIRFMERALTEHRDEVIAIYKIHLSGLFD